MFYRRSRFFKHTVRDSVGIKPNSVGQVAFRLDCTGLGASSEGPTNIGFQTSLRPTLRRNRPIRKHVQSLWLFKHTVRDSVGFKPNSVGQVAIKLDRAGLFGIRPILPGCWFVCTV